jgi:hypothetical protein
MHQTEGPIPKPGAAVYGEFLKDQLAAQDARKASFEQRGVGVVTTSGALVTLLFGFAALSSTNQILPNSAKKWLAASLIVFVVAAILALATNLPLPYGGPGPDEIKGRLQLDPPKDERAAQRDIALTRANMLKDAKKKNGWKGWMLFGALLLEVIAVALVGIAIFEAISP